MTVRFFEPPPAQRVGGLEAAVRALEAALRARGITVNGGNPEPGDVAHFHGLWQPAHARLGRSLRARGIPCVVSPHGMLEPWAWRHRRWKKWPYFHLVERWHLRRAACLLATAPQEASRLRTLFPACRVETLPLGLTDPPQPAYAEARAALGWAPEERVLLFLSRIHVKKGLDLLLEALTRIPLPAQARLVIVGGGESGYVETLRRFAREGAARLPRIEWAGEVWGDGRWKFFQGADLFCLPTHSENFGLAVLEACAVGTPVLTTVATPWADALAGQPAHICAPEVESVAAALTHFFSGEPISPTARQTFAAWTRARYLWEHLVAGYAELYESLLTPSGRQNAGRGGT